MRIARAFFVVMFALAAAAAPPQAVDVAAEPYHHLVLQNRFVRVFRVEVPPRAATRLHRHTHDYVFVTLAASEVSNEVEGKPPVKLELADGESRYAEGGFAHVARNLAATPFRNIAVEILPAGKRRAASTAHRKPAWERGVELFEGGSMHTLLVRGGLRVTETELKPGATRAQHRHTGPHLGIALTDLELRSDAPGKASQGIRQKAGELDWVPVAVTHALTNTGRNTARFISIEFR